ncbi:AraC family transcriptional regulator [Spirillospora sp. CA-108201]
MQETRHQPIAPTRARSLAPGAAIDDHRHDDHQIAYAGRGVVAVTTGTGTWVAPADRAIWIPAGAVHAHQAHGELELHLVGLPATDNPLGLDEPAVLVLHADPADDRTLAELGRDVGASDRTLSRLFRSDLGMTFPQWRTQLRLYHALILLAGNAPVTAVAHRCGWSSASTFIDVFRRAFGHTPGTHHPA